MKMIINEPLPNKVECLGSLKNILDALYVLNGKWKLALILCLVPGVHSTGKELSKACGKNRYIIYTTWKKSG